MKKSAVFCTAALVALTMLLAGCANGRYEIKNGKLESGSDFVGGSYELFDGEYYTRLELPLKKRVAFKIEAETLSGGIKFYMSDRSGNEREIKDGDVCELKSEDAKIKLIARAEDHKGSFKVSFEVLSES